jgi:hypothetical protein
MWPRIRYRIGWASVRSASMSVTRRRIGVGMRPLRAFVKDLLQSMCPTP